VHPLLLLLALFYTFIHTHTRQAQSASHNNLLKRTFSQTNFLKILNATKYSEFLVETTFLIFCYIFSKFATLINENCLQLAQYFERKILRNITNILNLISNNLSDFLLNCAKFATSCQKTDYDGNQHF